MVATDILANYEKIYLQNKKHQKELKKEAVTYEDMQGYVNRMKNSPNVIHRDFVDVASEQPGVLGKLQRKVTKQFEAIHNRPNKAGPVSMGSRYAKIYGYDKNLHNKIYMPSPKEVPHLYGGFVEKNDNKTITALQGAYFNHEKQELKTAKDARTLPGEMKGHMSISRVLGRADNNFAAAAEDEPTRKAAEYLKSMRQKRGELNMMENIALTKAKALQRLEGQKVNPGIARLSKVEKGEPVAPLETESNGLDFGSRKISRKEALARYYKELGADPNFALNPKNKDIIRKMHREAIEKETQALKDRHLATIEALKDELNQEPKKNISGGLLSKAKTLFRKIKRI